MKRRSILGSIASGVGVMWAGCSTIIANPIDLTLVNHLNQTVHVTVRLFAGDEAIYSETHTLRPDNAVTFEDVVDPGEYRLVVKRDGCTSESYIGTRQCKNPETIVTINPGCEIDVGGKQC
jgi:hypothetical protein